MNREYIEGVLTTESKDFEAIKGRIDDDKLRAVHAAMGCCTEASELLDDFKKNLFYGKPIDRTHVEEELGDLCWYMAVMADVYGFDFAEVCRKNLAKLKARYPNKFAEKDAIQRNLEKERKTLEG